MYEGAKVYKIHEKFAQHEPDGQDVRPSLVYSNQYFF